MKDPALATLRGKEGSNSKLENKIKGIGELESYSPALKVLHSILLSIVLPSRSVVPLDAQPFSYGPNHWASVSNRTAISPDLDPRIDRERMKGREHEREEAKGRRWKLKGKKRKEGSESTRRNLKEKTPSSFPSRPPASSQAELS